MRLLFVVVICLLLVGCFRPTCDDYDAEDIDGVCHIGNGSRYEYGFVCRGNPPIVVHSDKYVEFDLPWSMERNCAISKVFIGDG